jgi:hypothetical protein
MWIALFAALTAAPAQTGELKLSNLRSTYGVQGPARTSDKYLPGDVVTVSFDIDGIKADPSGKAAYSIALEVTDADGKPKFKQTPRDLEATQSLGGDTLPAFASVRVGLDEQPGKYTAKMIVTDRSTKASKSVSGAYEILPKGFGLVHLTTALDPEGRIPAPFLGTGQSLWVNFAAVGFERQAGQPNLNVVLRVLDKDGKPTVEKPLIGEVSKDIPDKLLALPMQFLLDLNREGSFTVELKATDKVSSKTATVSFPLTVQKSK